MNGAPQGAPFLFVVLDQFVDRIGKCYMRALWMIPSLWR